MTEPMTEQHRADVALVKSFLALTREEPMEPIQDDRPKVIHVEAVCTADGWVSVYEGPKGGLTFSDLADHIQEHADHEASEVEFKTRAWKVS